MAFLYTRVTYLDYDKCNTLHSTACIPNKMPKLNNTILYSLINIDEPHIGCNILKSPELRIAYHIYASNMIKNNTEIYSAHIIIV